jgi:hypothetical protein
VPQAKEPLGSAEMPQAELMSIINHMRERWVPAVRSTADILNHNATRLVAKELAGSERAAAASTPTTPSMRRYLSDWTIESGELH